MDQTFLLALVVALIVALAALGRIATRPNIAARVGVRLRHGHVHRGHEGVPEVRDGQPVDGAELHQLRDAAQGLARRGGRSSRSRSSRPHLEAVRLRAGDPAATSGIVRPRVGRRTPSLLADRSSATSSNGQPLAGVSPDGTARDRHLVTCVRVESPCTARTDRGGHSAWLSVAGWRCVRNRSRGRRRQAPIASRRAAPRTGARLRPRRPAARDPAARAARRARSPRRAAR